MPFNGIKPQSMISSVLSSFYQKIIYWQLIWWKEALSAISSIARWECFRHAQPDTTWLFFEKMTTENMEITRPRRAKVDRCRICGDVALYLFFGTISCQACKMFFKRHAEQKRVRERTIPLSRIRFNLHPLDGSRVSKPRHVSNQCPNPFSMRRLSSEEVLGLWNGRGKNSSMASAERLSSAKEEKSQAWSLGRIGKWKGMCWWGKATSSSTFLDHSYESATTGSLSLDHWSVDVTDEFDQQLRFIEISSYCPSIERNEADCSNS